MNLVVDFVVDLVVDFLVDLGLDLGYALLLVPWILDLLSSSPSSLMSPPEPSLGSSPSSTSLHHVSFR